jgi:hypothetical protein
LSNLSFDLSVSKFPIENTVTHFSCSYYNGPYKVLSPTLALYSNVTKTHTRSREDNIRTDVKIRMFGLNYYIRRPVTKKNIVFVNGVDWITIIREDLYTDINYAHRFRHTDMRGLKRRSAAARLLRLWVRIPPGAWMSVCCERCVLSGRGLCDELITRPEESYRRWCVIVY